MATSVKNCSLLQSSALARSYRDTISTVLSSPSPREKKSKKSKKHEEKKEISSKQAKEVFLDILTSGKSPKDVVREKGMKQILKPEFVTTITRKPVTYAGGVSFIIEAGLAYGGEAGRVVSEQRKSEIMRFANRVPLTFDAGSCAITEALKSIDWKRYGLRDMDNTPLTLFVNIISTQVPYLSTGKQSVSPEPEIVHEIRQATMKLARKLQKHLRAKRAAKEKEKRSKVFEEYVPVIIEEAAKLGETGVPDYQDILVKVTKRALAELLGEKVEEEDEEEELDAIIMEEVDEFGRTVETGNSTLDNFIDDDDDDELEE